MDHVFSLTLTFLAVFCARTGVEGPDVSATAPSVSGGAVQIGPADAGHPANGAPQPVNHPDSHSGRDRRLRLRGASAEGFTARDQTTQLHEQTWYVLEENTGHLPSRECITGTVSGCIMAIVVQCFISNNVLLCITRISASALPILTVWF